MDDLQTKRETSFIPPTPVPSSDHKEGRVIVLGILVLILIVGLSLWFFKDSAPPENDALVNDGPASGVEVERPDISGESTNKLPSGFPVNIPVEQERITESYKAVYAERGGVTQYTVSFSSLDKQSTLWNNYRNFMSAEGFVINEKIASESAGILMGTTEKRELSIFITSHESISYITLNYLEK